MKRKKTVKRKKEQFIIICFLIVCIIVISLLVLSKQENNIISKFVNKIWNEGENQGITVTYEETARQKFNFNFDWIFSKGEGKNNASSDIPAEDVQIISNDASILPYQSTYTINENNVGKYNEIWQNVSLPHTYNDIDTFDTFTERGYNGDRTTYSGTAWYKKEFFIPISYEGKKIYIEFEAARQAAKVYINGNLLTGTYENGFMPFGYDLTQYINYGETNYITVKVDNSYPYYMEGTSSPVTWHDTHWHPNYGGLYRNSYLYVIDPLHLTLPLYSFMQTEGTYIYTSNETDTTANINIEAQVENCYSESKTVKLVAYVKDMNGVALLEISSNNVTLATGEKQIICISDTLTNAIRWSTDYPYLYTVECKLIAIDNTVETVVDNNTTQIGIRTFKFTNNAGFYINDNYVKLQGWGQKSTNEWAGLGAAYSDWMQDYTIKLMKDAGANFIRWGHTAGSIVQVSAADKYGLITMQPGVDGEGETEGGIYTTNTYNLRTEAFRDMIIYYRNNPSILIWELGNQIMSEDVSQVLVSYIQRYDHGNRTYTTANTSGDYSYNSTEIKTNTGTYAYATSASVRMASVRRGIDQKMVQYVDIGVTTEGGGGMNSDTFGNKPEVEGEYNRLEARRGVWDTYTTGYENFQNEINRPADTSYQNVTSQEFAVYQASSYADMIGKTKHCGGANWIFSDSISHGRIGSEVARASGEVDGVMLPKESYWTTKVIFSDEESVHLIGHWNYTVGTVKNIYAIANCETGTQATLTVTDLNGTTTEYTGVKSKTYIWTFENVLYEEGSVRIDVKDEGGNIQVTDTITTHGEPASLRITPITAPNGLLANGSDVLLLDVELLDNNGNRCETFNGEIENIYTYFTVNNQTANENSDEYCIWRGGYNSGIEYSTNKKYLYLEARNY